MKTLKTLLLFFVSFFFTNCATVLNSKYQKVEIETPSSDTKVYVDDKYVGNGKTVTAKMERDLKTKQIKVEKEGFKPEYKVNYQKKKSPLYALSIVPFGILVYPMIFDIGPKSFNYSKNLKVRNKTKLIPKKEQQKFLYLKTASFNVDKNKLVVKTAKSKKYKKGKPIKDAAVNTEDINLDNTIFADAINNSLKKMGYVDTSRQVIKSRTNTLYVNADITALTIHSLRASARISTPQYVIAEPVVNWEIVDGYGQQKFSTKMKQKSGEFSIEYSNIEVQLTKAVQDAMDIALIKLLVKQEVQNLLNDSEESVNPNLEFLTISFPETEVHDLESATKATVTIKNGDSHGSGFFISKDGYILTNYHVVAGSTNLRVLLQNKKEFDAEMIRHNESNDLALVKIKETVPMAFRLSSDRNFKIGNEVFSIGTPASVDLGQTVSKGIISAVREQNDQEWIQTDVSVNFGNSGGPLVNPEGQLIGMVNSKIVGFGMEGIAFCIPAHEIANLLKLDIRRIN